MLKKKAKYFLKDFSCIVILLSLMVLPSCTFLNWFKKNNIIPKSHVKELEYIVSPELGQEQPRINVDLFIKLKSIDPEKNMLRIIVPPSYGAAKELYKDIKNIQVVNKGISIKNTEKPYVKIIENISKDKVHVRYQVVCSIKNLDNFQYGERGKAQITNKYFFLIGHNFIVRPCWGAECDDQFPDNAKLHVTMKWKNIPKEWNIINNYGINQKEQHICVPIVDLVHAAYMAGDFEIETFICKGYPVHLVTRKDLVMDKKVFIETAKKIISAERTFWNDYDFPFFFISIMSLGQNRNFGGYNFFNSIALYRGEKHPNPMKKYKYYIAHEYFHTWNGRKIMRDESEELLYWFSEGFTDYYAYLFLLRAKLITLQDYISTYNEFLHNLFISPAKNAPNEKIRTDMWNDSNVFKLPYWRGNVLAHQWNCKIKKATSNTYSLDDVMCDILKECAENNKLLSNELFKTLIKKYVTKGIDKEFEKYVVHGETIIPDKDALGPCCTLVWKKIEVKQKDGSVKIYDVPQYVLNEEKYEKNKENCLSWFGVK